MAGEYWFDGDNGLAANNGLSAGAPKKHFAAGMGLDYSGTFIVNVKRGTTVEIQIGSFRPTGDCIIRPYGDGTERARILLTSTNQVIHTGASGSFTISPGMHIIGQGTSNGRFCSAERGALYVDDVWIEGCYNGVWPGAGTGYVRNSRIWNIGNNGVNVGNTSYAATPNFEISNNYIDATGAASDPISYHDGTGTAVGGRCFDNVCIGGGDNGIGVEEQYGGIHIFRNKIYSPANRGIAHGGFKGIVIGNYVEGAAGAGLSPSNEAAGGGTVFCGNLVYDCGRTKDANGFVARTDQPWFAYNNTFVSGPNSSTPRMVDFPEAGVTGTMRNNIFVVTGSQRYVQIFDADAALLLLSNNLYFGSSAANPYTINNGTAQSVAQWQALAALGGGTQDDGSKFSDPLFANGYRLSAASPCKGAGVYIPGAKHFGGHSMSVVSPDIGAYRYFPVRETVAR
jgi:hypothetical protein